MFLRLLARSLLWRKKIALLSAFVIMLAALTVSFVANTLLDIAERLRGEFRKFGPNLVLTKEADDSDPLMDYEGVLKSLEKSFAGLKWRSVPQLIMTGEVNGVRRTIVASGVDSLLDLIGTYHLDGRPPAEENEILIGKRLAQQTGIRVGDRVRVVMNSTDDLINRWSEPALEHQLKSPIVSGIIATGEETDDQILVSLDLEEKSAKSLRASLVLINLSEGPRTIEGILRSFNEENSGLVLRPIRKVTEAESVLFYKVKWLLTLTCLFVLGTVALTIISLTSAQMIERTKEIALLKVCGMTDRSLILLLILELSSVAVFGTTAGITLGLIASKVMGLLLFGSAVGYQLFSLPITMVVTVLLLLIGGIHPFRILYRISPAEVLKGE